MGNNVLNQLQDAFRSNGCESGKNLIKENFLSAFQTFNKLVSINLIHLFPFLSG